MVRKRISRFFSFLYSSLYVGAGKGAFISIHAELRGSNINIGARSRILKNVKLDTSSNPSNADYLKFTTKGRITIGDNVTIKDYVLLISYDGQITIGNSCTINPFTIVYGHGGVTIGSNVMIAANCIIVSSNHNFESITVPILKQGITAKGILIEDDVWIGANVKILDGVTIGRGSVVAAGSVVNKSLEGFGVYGGIPAKLLRKREEF